MTTLPLSSNPSTSKLFNTAVLFSGGGLRFGYYLGMYQALCDKQQQPDIVLASCGGAFAAGLLEVSEDSRHAFRLLQSRACYDMLCRITPKPPKRASGYLLPAITRWSATQGWQLAKKLPLATGFYPKFYPKKLQAVTEHSIAYIANESATNPLWQWHSPKDNTGLNSLIIASRFQSINNRYHWQIALRCGTQFLADNIEHLSLSNALAHYHPSIVDLHWITAEMPLSVAVRASISDMYYLPPVYWQGNTLMGGVLNLTPIELACQLANTVYAETKDNYDTWMAEPAIHATFGFFANERLNHVLQYQHPNTQIHWINTADNAHHIRPAMVKKLRLRQGYIDVKRPDFATFQAIMREQYDYGYERTIAKLRESS